MTTASTPLQQAETLMQALPHMLRYDDQIVVVKYGGHAMENEELKESFARFTRGVDGVTRATERVKAAIDSVEKNANGFLAEYAKRREEIKNTELRAAMLMRKESIERQIGDAITGKMLIQRPHRREHQPVTGDPLRTSCYVFGHNGRLGFPVVKKIALPGAWPPPRAASLDQEAT